LSNRQRWEAAQQIEVAFWNGFVRSEPALLEALSNNAQKALQLRKLLAGQPRTCLEIGIGPLGVGVTGFLREVPLRFGLDPLKRVEPDCSKPLREFIDLLRAPIQHVVGCGESLPLEDGSIDLVVCCNVLDHVREPDAILAEIRRVLRPHGHLFLEVHTFSLLGLLKWHLWTKHRHRDEVVVKAHPYRFFEWVLHPKLKAQGLQIVRKEGHSLLSLCAGHARGTAFLAVKRDGAFRNHIWTTSQN
jgi:SAM-dependent methyltransferase